MSEVDAQPPQENPLTNILVNVIVPVLALSYLSKDPQFETNPKFWHLGPKLALVLALALPIGYGIWFFLKHRKPNFFSALGFISVLLTGGLTLYFWNGDGTIKPNAAPLFGIKEASIPLVLGLAILASHWTKTPLLNAFVYSPQLFDLQRITQQIEANDAHEPYRKLLFSSTIIFSASFLISTVMNFFLALYFLGDIDHTAADARTQYNAGVAKLTGWGFAVIGVPILILLMFLFFRLMRGLRALTGLEDDKILLPR